MDGNQKMPHSRNLRKGRYSSSLEIYLITAVTWNRTPVFADIWAGRKVVQVMRDYQRSAETLCYVIMPDHVHWLFQLLPGYSLSQVVGGVKRNSAYRVNRYLNRQNRLWQDGFHDRALRRDEDMKSMARYIVANPLRAGLVSDIGNYPLWDAPGCDWRRSPMGRSWHPASRDIIARDGVYPALCQEQSRGSTPLYVNRLPQNRF